MDRQNHFWAQTCLQVLVKKENFIVEWLFFTSIIQEWCKKGFPAAILQRNYCHFLNWLQDSLNIFWEKLTNTEYNSFILATQCNIYKKTSSFCGISCCTLCHQYYVPPIISVKWHNTGDKTILQIKLSFALSKNRGLCTTFWTRYWLQFTHPGSIADIKIF